MAVVGAGRHPSEDIALESVKKAKALVLAQLAAGFRPRPSNVLLAVQLMCEQ